jgi:hypothetical protein
LYRSSASASSIEQREIVQRRRRDIAVVRTMGLLHVRQQALRQRDCLRIFAGPAEFCDPRTARGHATVCADDGAWTQTLGTSANDSIRPLDCQIS